MKTLARVVVALLALVYTGSAFAAAPTFVDKTSATTNASSITVSKPTLVAAGDLMLAYLDRDISPGTGTTVAPSGWTYIGIAEFVPVPDGADHIRLEAWKKTATAAEPVVYTFTTGNASTDHMVVGIAAFRGADFNLDASATNNNGRDNTTQNIASASVTTTGADRLVVSAFATDGSSSIGADTFDPLTPAGLTSRLQAQNVADGTYHMLGVLSENRVSAGSGAHTVDDSQSFRQAPSIIVALKPSSTLQPDTTISSWVDNDSAPTNIDEDGSGDETTQLSWTGSNGATSVEYSLNGGAYVGSTANPVVIGGIPARCTPVSTLDVRAVGPGGTDATPAHAEMTMQPAAGCGGGGGGGGGGGPVSWQNGLDSWGGTTFPDATWRPFADTSPWNTQLPATPQLASNSTSIVSRIYGMDGNATTKAPKDMFFSTLMTPDTDDWSHPTFWGRAGDTLLTIHCTQYACPDLEGKQVPIPSQARAAGGGDGHVGIVLRDSTKPYHLFVVDIWKASTKPSSGTWNVASGGISRVDGTGQNLGTASGGWTIDSQTGQSEATAARFSVLAGMIRAQELAAGAIPHALFMVIDCDSGSFVFPAQKVGSDCQTRQGTSNVNAPPMGTRIFLDMADASIDALAVKPSWKAILKALHHYGAFFGDTGGGSWNFMFESPETYHAFGVQTPMATVASNEAWVANGSDWVLKGNNVPDTVWANIKVVAPCVSQGTC